jgi:DNA-binding transcriptional ArsR family regulator
MLADPTRLEIINLLLEGERCACDIIPNTKKTQSTISIQLNKLKKNKILTSRKDGRKVIYRIKDYRICEMLRVMGNKKVKCLNKNCCK